MPYKDPEKQRQASHASYLRNKQAIMERQAQRRKDRGRESRLTEYARKRGMTVEEYLVWREGAPERAREAARLAAARRSTVRTSQLSAPKPSRSKPRRISVEEQALIDEQRRMKAQALGRLGISMGTIRSPRVDEK